MKFSKACINSIYFDFHLHLICREKFCTEKVDLKVNVHHHQQTTNLLTTTIKMDFDGLHGKHTRTDTPIHRFLTIIIIEADLEIWTSLLKPWLLITSQLLLNSHTSTLSWDYTESNQFLTLVIVVNYLKNISISTKEFTNNSQLGGEKRSV